MALEPAEAPAAYAPSNGVARVPAGMQSQPRQDRPLRARPPRPAPLPIAAPSPAADAEPVDEDAIQTSTCTLAQMRRFIKSRPYVPVHELRRRFLIEGIEDEVNPLETQDGRLFVGLPQQQASFLGELIKAGEVGCELLLDPTSPAVIGVFPMRPVARQ